MPPRARSLALLIFFQMLPATLVVPAIRPLFAAFHGGNEGAMHAFSGVNMLGAALVAPIVGALMDRGFSSRRILLVLAVCDGLLLAAVSLPLPTTQVLILRALEGGAHVGAATVLMAEMAQLGRETGRQRLMGLAGAGIIFAIALGSAVGALLLKLDSRAPLWFGALLAFGVAAVSAKSAPRVVKRERVALVVGQLLERREFLVPVGAAFIARFTVGCLIVTFALFSHRVHQLSDTHIGLLFSILTLTFAFAMYPAARLSERVAPARLLGGAGAVYAVALLTLAYAPRPLLALWMFVAGLTSALLFSTILGYAAASREALQGTAMAWVNAAGSLGMLLGPITAGVVSTWLKDPEDLARGYRAVFTLAGMSLVIWLVLSARWLHHMGREETRALAEKPPADGRAAA